MDLSEYYKKSYNKEKSLITITWKPATDRMSDTAFKAVLIEILDAIKIERPEFYLANTQHFLFTIIPELQDWANKYFVHEIYQLGVKKMGVVVSADLFAQVSIEQVLSDDGSGMQSAYFPSVEKAENWLK